MSSASAFDVELEETRIVGGEPLRGRVRAEDGGIDRVLLRGGWRRRVEGGDAVEETAFEREISAAEDGSETTFEMEAPTGPYSFEGQTATLEWELEAIGFDVDGEEVASATSSFVLTAGDPRERPTDSSSSDVEEQFAQTWFGDILESLSSAFGHPSSREELVKRLEYVDTGTGPYERQTSLTGNLPAILILMGFGIAGLTMAGAAFEDPHPAVPWVIRAVGLALTAWGGWIAYKGIRNKMAQAALGDVEVEVHPDEIVLGDDITCSIAFSPERDVELNSVEATLKCVRIEKTKGPKHRHGHHHHHDDDDDDSRFRTRTYTDTLFSEPIELAGASEGASGETFAFAERFTVPETSRSSYFHRAPFWARMLPLRGLTLSVRIKWVVELHVDIADWPDYVTEYQCVVYP